MVGDADGESRPFAGIRPRAQLIEKDEGMRGDPAEYADDVLDVCGEGGEALLYALLVADVAVNTVHHGHLRALCGDVQPGESHTHEKPRHF